MTMTITMTGKTRYKVGPILSSQIEINHVIQQPTANCLNKYRLPYCCLENRTMQDFQRDGGVIKFFFREHSHMTSNEGQSA